MLLEEKEDLLLAKLIGINNALFGEIKSIEDTVRKSLKALKNKENVDFCINELIEIKDREFENCKTCASPCGRTSDVSLNALNDTNKNEIAMKLINNYSDSLELDYISLELSKLAW